MGSVELDPTETMAFMVVGGICIAFALYLLVRPPHHGTTKLEMFGMKFEASSAAILVFLAGLALLLTPVWSEEAESSGDDTRMAVSGASGTDAEGETRPAFRVVPPDEPGAEETEPNDRVQQANGLSVGATVAGRVTSGDTDRYLIDTAGRDGEMLVVTLRQVSGGRVYGEVFDSNERRIAQLSPTGGGSAFTRERIDGSRMYVMVTQSSLNLDQSPGRYEVTSRIEAE